MLKCAGCQSNINQSINGITIIIDKKLNSLINGYITKNDRIIKFDTKPIRTNVVQVYATTCATADEIVETLYTRLQIVVDGIFKRELIIIMGDINRWIMVMEDLLCELIVKFGLGQGNVRGDGLIEFAMFQHHPRRLGTWKCPGNTYKNRVDYMLISKRSKSSCINAVVYPGAKYGSDHKLLVMKLHGRMKKKTPAI